MRLNISKRRYACGLRRTPTVRTIRLLAELVFWPVALAPIARSDCRHLRLSPVSLTEEIHGTTAWRGIHHDEVKATTRSRPFEASTDARLEDPFVLASIHVRRSFV